MPTYRTLEPPRFHDDWSFNGRGRKLYQVTAPNRFGDPIPLSPPLPASVGPGEPRG